ncbi:transmembrane protein 272-like [Centropristis striata]|uniref:transmembrane protein 272-like n=1 Tax=Centropristis striata TaxID=184440 RepID=UPI0027E1E4C3|nr:transmembrane protein 272-like [Centropristis striata]
MEPSPLVEYRPRSAVSFSCLVVMNIIWWMVMIAAIGLGAMHLRNCPVQPRIPLYLIVLGAVTLFALSLTYTRPSWGDGRAAILCSTTLVILHLFSFSWYIAGSTWVYPIYPPNYAETSEISRYCQKTTYMFAFVVTTVVWSTSVLTIFCGCCFGLLTCCKTVRAGSRLIPSRSSFYGATSDSQDAVAGDV